jgi:hypothetical protein
LITSHEFSLAFFVVLFFGGGLPRLGRGLSPPAVLPKHKAKKEKKRQENFRGKIN